MVKQKRKMITKKQLNWIENQIPDFMDLQYEKNEANLTEDDLLALEMGINAFVMYLGEKKK